VAIEILQLGMTGDWPSVLLVIEKTVCEKNKLRYLKRYILLKPSPFEATLINFFQKIFLEGIFELIATINVDLTRKYAHFIFTKLFYLK